MTAQHMGARAGKLLDAKSCCERVSATKAAAREEHFVFDLAIDSEQKDRQQILVC
jgi:hypothetical protein